jgi:hypothetical protein
MTTFIVQGKNGDEVEVTASGTVGVHAGFVWFDDGNGTVAMFAVEQVASVTRKKS